MSNVLGTYSFKDLNFALNSPLGGTILAAGVEEKGVNELQVRMTTDQTSMKVGADGAVIPSAIPGDNGEIEIQVWQNSVIHTQLLAWYNALRVARDAGDVSLWAATTIFIQNIISGRQHMCLGVAPVKVPDQMYQAEAQAYTWTLRAASIITQ